MRVARGGVFALGTLVVTSLSCGGSATAPTKPRAGAQDEPQGTTCSRSSNLGAAAATPDAESMLVEVEVRGAREGRELCGLISSKPNEALSADKVDLDIQRMWARGTVEDVVARVEPAPGGQRLVFEVHDRPRITSARLDIPGRTDLDNTADYLPKPGPLDPAEVFDKKEKLLADLKAQGYRRASAKTRLEQLDGNVGAGGVELVLEVDVGIRAYVQSLGFPTIAAARASEIAPLLLTSPKHVLDPEALERDRLVITAYYYDHGMVEVEVGDPKITESSDGESLDVSIPITEGAVYHVGQVKFTGQLLDRVSEYKKRFWSLPPGAVFNRTVIATDVNRLNDYHRMQNFNADANLMTDVDQSKHRIDVTIELKKQ